MQTTIWRSKAGISVEVGKAGVVTPWPGAQEIIKELGYGESFEMEIKIDQGTTGKVRFTHK